MDKKAMKIIAGAGITVEQFGRAMRRLGSSPAFREFYTWYSALCMLTLPDYIIQGKRKPVWMRIRDWYYRYTDLKTVLAIVWLTWLCWIMTAILAVVWG